MSPARQVVRRAMAPSAMLSRYPRHLASGGPGGDRRQVPAAGDPAVLPRPAGRGPVPAARDRARPRGCPARRRTTCSASWRRRASSCTWPRSGGTGSASAPTSSAPATSGRRRCSGSPGCRWPRWSTRPGTAPTWRCCTAARSLYVIEERAPGRAAAGHRRRRAAARAAHGQRAGDARRASRGAASARCSPARRRSSPRTDRGPRDLRDCARCSPTCGARGYATEDGDVTPGFARSRRRCSITPATRKRASR